MLALVDLLLVVDNPNYLFLWLDGCLGVEPRVGLTLAEGLCYTWGGPLHPYYMPSCHGT